MNSPFNLPTLIDVNTPATPKDYGLWLQESPSTESQSPSPQRKRVGKLVFPLETQQSIVVTIGSLLTRSGVRKSQRNPKPNTRFL